LSDAEEAVNLSLDAPDHREHKQIANKIDEELNEAKNNFKLLSQQAADPVELNMTYLMAYNGNIMTIKQLLNKWNIGEMVLLRELI
jgi:molybdenum cofactor biosynthesis enzyme MoaA